MEHHNGFAHYHGLERRNQQRQQRAQQHANQQIQAARQASLQQHANSLQQARRREAALRQLTARFNPDLAPPTNLWAIFEETRGRSAGPLIERQYSPAQIQHWRNQWFETTLVGKQVFEELVALAAKEEEAEKTKPRGDGSACRSKTHHQKTQA